VCGIVGFLDKRGGHERPVGRTILAMLQALSCRGPDSAGVAIFGPPRGGCVMRVKLPEGAAPHAAEAAVLQALHDTGAVLRHTVVGACLRLELDGCADTDCLESTLLERVAMAEIVSLGRQLQIAKQVGSPEQLEQTYGVAQWAGTHGIGHTRLSTESRVDLSHSQPFWAHGVPDLATVHNGHITNYHKLRRRFEQEGYHFYTDNDSEVIGVYLRDRMAAGRSLEGAMQSSLEDFDGSFCYLAASKDRLGFVKDRYGFKPLMLAENEDFVALATEEIALRQALGRDFAAYEPAPGTMRLWSINNAELSPTHAD